MTADELLTFMKAGHELRNFGVGWWLQAPRVGRTRVDPVKVDDTLVRAMEDDGTIKTTMLTTSMRADLVLQA